MHVLVAAHLPERAAEERILRGRAERLAVWNRLLHSVPVRVQELDFRRLCGTPSLPYEAAACVALRACAELTNSSGRTIQSALRISILYWFSNLSAASEAAREHLRPKCSAFHLQEAVGARLTWDEAVAAMKRQPIDRAAYAWLMDVFQAEYRRQWNALFRGTPTPSIAALSGSLCDDPHARNWCCPSHPARMR
jgi:hypothetical protein